MFIDGAKREKERQKAKKKSFRPLRIRKKSYKTKKKVFRWHRRRIYK